MYNSAFNVHANDKRNLSKHAKMTARAVAGTLNPNCKWARKHGYAFTAPCAKFAS